MSKRKFTYLPKLNPRNSYIPGVPLGNLSEKQFDQLSPVNQAAVEREEFYRKYKPRKKPELVLLVEEIQSGEVGADPQGVMNDD